MKRSLGALSLLLASGAVVYGCSAANDDAQSSNESGVREGTLQIANQTIPIHYEMKDGVPTWQGDIDLRPADLESKSDGLRPDSFTIGTYAAMFSAGRLWANETVPYRFDSTITTTYQATIQTAMADWTNKLGFTFTHDTSQTAADYLLFTSDTTGCHTGLGHSPGANVVHIQDPAATGFGCSFPQIVHEIGHEIGLQHEMNRPDRNSYVIIESSNICSGQASVAGGEQCAGYNRTSQFDDTVPGAPVGSFDFTSIMLYPSTTSDPTFALNTSKPIIALLDGGAYANPQTNAGLSTGDVAGVMALYNLAWPAGPSCTYTASPTKIGQVYVTCTVDSASDPIYVFQKNASGGWNYIYGYQIPYVLNGGQEMLSNVPAGTTDTFLACTYSQADFPQVAPWLPKVAPGIYGCSAAATSVTIPTPPPPPVCTPITCGNQPGMCGATWTNGCGTPMDCGPCTPGNSCDSTGFCECSTPECVCDNEGRIWNALTSTCGPKIPVIIRCGGAGKPACQ